MTDQFFFSPSKAGFYTPAIHGAAIPEDALPLSAEEHQALLEAQSCGKKLGVDESGRPAALDPVPQPVTSVEVKEEAGRRIAEAMPDWMGVRQISGGTPIPEALKNYAAQVREACEELETRDEIPRDFRDDRYWPKAPAH